MIWRRLTLGILAAALLTTGCAAETKPTGGPSGGGGGGKPAACKPGDAASYFPYKAGMKAHFAGQGNEYAAFDLTILKRQGKKLEWRRATGGTTLAEVFETTPERVRLIYAEEEAYDLQPRIGKAPNRDETWIQAPIKPGTTWTARGTTYTIESTNAMADAAGRQLTCVLVVKGTSGESVIRRYYHQDYGLVLQVFQSGEATVESRLTSLTR